MTEQAIERFAPQIKHVVRHVCDAFHIQGSDRDDVNQEALILTATYAGELPGWQHGKIREWESIAGDDESRIRALFTVTLNGNLSQVVSRMRQLQMESLDQLRERGFDIAAPESSTHDEADLRASYPLFCLNALDGYTQPEIAAMMHCSERTVRSRISEEKQRFLADRNLTKDDAA